MRKIFKIAMTAGLLAAGIASCSKDNHSEATCNYIVYTDSIVYTDIANKEHDSVIRLCVKDMNVSDYTFSKHAETNTSSATYAAALCNDLAKSEYENKMKQIFSLSDLQNKLFTDNGEYFKKHNISSPQEIGLKPFTVKTTLYNTQYLTTDAYVSKKDAEVK